MRRSVRSVTDWSVPAFSGFISSLGAGRNELSQVIHKDKVRQSHAKKGFEGWKRGGRGVDDVI